MDISSRKRLILQKIIALYTMYGDPVGSKYLEPLLEISVSSATIRNEMAELTELGLLEQPYTSAGRIPTTMGFKYYVDNLLRAKPLTDEEKQLITKIIAEMDTDPDKAAEQAAKFLAHMTGLAAITTTPKGGNIQITRFEIVKTGRYNLALLGITSIGGVKSRVCRVAEELDERQLSAVNSVINDHLVFVSPEDIDQKLLNTVSAFFGNDAMLLAPIVSAAVAIIKSASDVKVFAEGQQNLLTYEELDDSIKELLELFSDSEAIMSRMNVGEQLSFFVGGAFGIENLGMVMGRYRVAGGRHGVLAIAGPVRMDYGFVIPRLSFFRDIMSAALTNPGFN